jgi:hypothetical protein
LTLRPPAFWGSRMVLRLDTMADQLAEIHAVLLQAKGARWVLISTAIAIGFAIANLKSLAQLLSLTK